jgi:hypothetical protein
MNMQYAESKAIRRLNALVLLKLVEKIPFEIVYNNLGFFINIIVPEVKLFVFIKRARGQNGKEIIYIFIIIRAK